jgi:hypothetical protein
LGAVVREARAAWDRRNNRPPDRRVADSFDHDRPRLDRRSGRPGGGPPL